MFRSFRRARWIGGAAAGVLLGVSSPADAWYFPEHVVLAEEGLAWLPGGAKAALGEAVREMAASSLVCERLEESFYVTSALRREACVPYATLAALAGDHASTVRELWSLVRKDEAGETGQRLQFGARTQWRDFLGKLREEDAAAGLSDRTDLVRDLDIYLLGVDGDYVDRAKQNVTHFQAAGEPLTRVAADLARRGRVDNALGQFIGHHLRSLQLATGAREAPTGAGASLRRDALLEHAYALHFLQDAFAAGHAVITAKLRRDPEERIGTHDHFNRIGVSVTRALNAVPCPLLRAGVNDARAPGLPPCWETTGDGFLGVRPASQDRLHAAEATARAQLQLAMALDPRWVEQLLEPAACSQPAPAPSRRARPRDVDLTMALLDPTPAWSLGPQQRKMLSPTCERVRHVLRSALAALARLRERRAIPGFSGNTSEDVPRLVEPGALGQPFALCTRPAARTDPGIDWFASVLCGDPERVVLGAPDTSLLRPILAVWPVPQAEAGSLEGEDPIARGFSYQVWLSSPFAVHGAPVEQPTEVSWNPSFLVGVSYRWQYVLSGRPNAALFEANVGLQTTVRSGDRAHFGSFALAELRTPVLSMMFWAMANGVTRAFDGGRGLADTADVIELMPCGTRLYFDLTSAERPFFDGFDIEGPALLLPLARDLLGTQGVSRMPLEVRSRFGCAQRCEAFSVSLELATGVSRLF
ncbi:hypothetical protein [Sorangium sp. So ce1151]|uniref:hypothetical protein n=1 Tax=Sorangium sp. So ce1151 TaxID=3133332 RepID=UPI003F5ED11E